MSGIGTRPPESGYASKMSVRDYFIAHAPSDAPKWFFPVMPGHPIVPSVHSLPMAELRIELNTFFNGNKEREDLTPEALAWVDRREKSELEQEEWRLAFRVQCYVQWPCAWADMMLAARKAPPRTE